MVSNIERKSILYGNNNKYDVRLVVTENSTTNHGIYNCREYTNTVNIAYLVF